MRCKKYCKCSECEMAVMDSVIAIDDRNPFCEKRVVVPMPKCLATGSHGQNTTGLKTEQYKDDFIYGEEALQLISDVENGFIITGII